MSRRQPNDAELLQLMRQHIAALQKRGATCVKVEVGDYRTEVAFTHKRPADLTPAIGFTSNAHPADEVVETEDE